MPYNYSQINMSSDKLQAYDSPCSVSIMSKIFKILANQQDLQGKAGGRRKPCCHSKDLVECHPLSSQTLSCNFSRLSRRWLINDTIFDICCFPAKALVMKIVKRYLQKAFALVTFRYDIKVPRSHWDQVGHPLFWCALFPICRSEVLDCCR